MSAVEDNERNGIQIISTEKYKVVKPKNFDLKKNPTEIIRSNEIEEFDTLYLNQCCQGSPLQVATGRTFSDDCLPQKLAVVVGFTRHGSYCSAHRVCHQPCTKISTCSTDCSSDFSVGEQFKLPDYCMESAEQSRVIEVFAQKKQKIREEMTRLLEENRSNSDAINNYQMQRQAAYLERCELQKEAFNLCRRVQRAEVGILGIRARFSKSGHTNHFCCSAKMAHINHYQHRLDQVRIEVAKIDCNLQVREAANERLSLKNDEIKSDIKQMLAIIQDYENELVSIQKALAGKTNQNPQAPQNLGSVAPKDPKPPISDQPNASIFGNAPPLVAEKPIIPAPNQPGSQSREITKSQTAENPDRSKSDKPHGPALGMPERNSPEGQNPHIFQFVDARIPENREKPIPVLPQIPKLTPKVSEQTPENPGNFTIPKPAYHPVSEVPKPPSPVCLTAPLYHSAFGNSSEYKPSFKSYESATIPPAACPPYNPHWPCYFVPICLPSCPPSSSSMQEPLEPLHSCLKSAKKSNQSDVRYQKDSQLSNGRKPQIKSQPTIKHPHLHEPLSSSKLDRLPPKKPEQDASTSETESNSASDILLESLHSSNSSENSLQLMPDTPKRPIDTPSVNPNIQRHTSSDFNLDPLSDISTASSNSASSSDSPSSNKTCNPREVFDGKKNRGNVEEIFSASTSRSQNETNNREKSDFRDGYSQNQKKDGSDDDDCGRGRGGGYGRSHSHDHDFQSGNNRIAKENQNRRKSCYGGRSYNCKRSKDGIVENTKSHVHGNSVGSRAKKQVARKHSFKNISDQSENCRNLAKILKNVNCFSGSLKELSQKMNQTASLVTYMSLTVSSSRRTLTSKCSLSDTVHKKNYESSNFSDEKPKSEDRLLNIRTSTSHLKSNIYEKKTKQLGDSSSKKLRKKIDQLAVTVKMKDKKLNQYEKDNQQLLLENAKLTDLMEEVASLKKENAILSSQIEHNIAQPRKGVALAQQDTVWKESSKRCIKRTVKLERLLINVSKQSQNNLRDYMKMANRTQSYQEKLNQVAEGIFKQTPATKFPKQPLEKSDKANWIRYCKEVMIIARKLDEKSKRQKYALGIINGENDELLRRNEELVKKLQMHAETEERYIKNNFGSPLKSELDILRRKLEKYEQNARFANQNDLQKQVEKLSKELEIHKAKLEARETELENLNYGSIDELSKMKKENRSLVEALESERDEVRRLSNQLLVTNNVLEEHKQEVEKLNLDLAVARRMDVNRIDNHISASTSDLSNDPLLVNNSGFRLKTRNSRQYSTPLRQSSCSYYGSKPVIRAQGGSTQNLHPLYQAVQRAVEGAITNISFQQRDNVGIHNELRKLNRAIAQLKSKSLFMARELYSRKMGSEPNRQKDPTLHRICSQIITEGISTLEFRELIYLHYAVYNAGVEIQMNTKIRTKFASSLGTTASNKTGNSSEMVRWDFLERDMSATKDIIRKFRDKPKNWF